eukprot:TRINITY_DN69745_c0_g1_i2.p1 TRINITY_DN69745_c0_g1~~TRINITY_DN69745_c0_g1_i2.p1  ORF type:complete len:219 (+),score=35.73 TRINITY_DN69745_c0_g1_i2:40-696(+)
MIRIVLQSFFLMIRRPPRSTQGVSSAASDVYKRQVHGKAIGENKCIEKLVFEETSLVESTGIMRGIILNRSIITLELKAPQFSTEALSALGLTLKKNQLLRVLKLIGEFEKGGASGLSSGLEVNQSIQYISLTNSNIRKKESLSFLYFLRRNTSLEFLHMYVKVLDLDEGDIQSLKEILLKNLRLKFFGFSRGSLPNAGIKELKKIQLKHFWLKLEIF